MSKPLSERLNDARFADAEISPRIFSLLEEAESLARRVEVAGIAHVEPKNGVAVIHERAMPLDMIGQRVALVPMEGGA